jgi:threonine synthase
VRYVSTRGDAPPVRFNELLLSGLAPDGGLYVPEAWPVFEEDEIRALSGLPYTEVVRRIISPYIGDTIAPDVLDRIVIGAYQDFDHAGIAPLRQLSSNEWLLELFHGPTLAFKDYALQLLGRLIEHSRALKGEHITIVGATSGDTGSAAIDACRGLDRVDAFILHPKDRVSEVQRRQMTTVTEANIHNIAVEGTFDDCQAMVKAMFNERAFSESFGLTAVNSINWARVMAQIVYYFYAAVALGAPDRQFTFVVPTGNFGDVYAGYAAYRMGLPVSRLVVATNRNDILTRFFESAEYRKDVVHPTISPSMDIQVSSNFERLLFESLGRDGAAIASYMSELDTNGGFRVGDDCHAALRQLFSARAVSEDETLASMAAMSRDYDLLIDPHTAVGISAARAVRDEYADGSTPVIVLATAHPAKFPDAVEQATGARPALPPHISDLYDREERYDVLPNDVVAIQDYIRERISVGQVRGLAT